MEKTIDRNKDTFENRLFDIRLQELKGGEAMWPRPQSGL